MQNTNSQKTPEASVLNSIYRGARIGRESVANILPKTEHPGFRDDLRTQEGEYDAICKEAANRLAEMGNTPDPIEDMKKMTMKAAVNMNTLMNCDTSHLADIMIRGSTMGITNMTKILNGYQNPDPQVAGLAQKLITTEQQNIERLKVYLQ
ncbi:MAG: hypothetical protein IJL71_02730 [Oscillospiraceae bacterium]|nr:hypothetical protein [Oscillospiraceae bacterium]